MDAETPWWLRPPADDNGADAPTAPDEGSTAAPESTDPDAGSDEAAAGDGSPDEAGEDRASESSDGARESRPKRSRSRRRRSRSRGRASSAAKVDEVEVEARRAETQLEEIIQGADDQDVDLSGPERNPSVNGNEERRIALFCDLENIALGVRDSDIKKLDIHLVLERLLEKGKIIVKKAYADWERYSEFKRPLHEAAIEMIDIPQKYYSGKNSADMKMAVDAIELCYSKDHVDTFAILSGDSDFSPLVSKLRESNKRVIGVGVKNSSSNLLIDNCDEFLFYEDIWREQQTAPKLNGIDKKKGEAFSLMIDSMKALMRENKDVLWGSMIKQTMQRKRPSFNEGYHGYSSFSDLLEDAERHNIVKLKRDQRSGTYVVTGFSGKR